MAESGSVRGTSAQNSGGFANAAGSFAIAPRPNILDRARAIQGIFNSYNPSWVNPAYRSANSNLPIPHVSPRSSNLDFTISIPNGDPQATPVELTYNTKLTQKSLRTITDSAWIGMYQLIEDLAMLSC